MPGTRIKRQEAEAMFEEFVKGASYRGLAEKFSRSVDRVRSLAHREGWEARRRESHEESLRIVMAQSAKRKAERIQGIEWIIARLLEQLQKRHEASNRRGLDGLSDAEAAKLALEAVREVRKERGESDGSAPAVQVQVATSGPVLIAGKDLRSMTDEELAAEIVRREKEGELPEEKALGALPTDGA